MSVVRSLVRDSRAFTTLAGFALFVIAAAPAKAQTPVAFGDTISEPGVYFLHGNQSGSGDGITIESSDVLLLLSRFTLRGDGSGVGINSNGNSNITIWGGRVTNFRWCIFLNGGEDCTVKDTRLDHSEIGLYFVRMHESSVLRVRSDHHATEGILLLNSRECRLVSVLSHDNGENGILFADADTLAAGDEPNGNTARLCWAAYNGSDGIELRNSQENVVKKNQCVGNRGAGIRLASSSDNPPSASSGPTAENSSDNQVESNWCVFNQDGIVMEWGSTSNTVVSNTALANFGHDMVERNDEPPCVNTWFLNVFLTKDGSGEDCIF